MNNIERIEAIQTALRHAFPDATLEVIDESAAHRGHPGARSGGGHFALSIISIAFLDQPLVQRHQMIYSALSDLMGKEIHALRIIAAKTN